MCTPRIMDLELTSRCNLRCGYCYFQGRDEPACRDLPTAEWLTFFDELGELGVMEVILGGGEAILRPDIRKLIAGIVDRRMRFTVLSNGLAIDDDLAGFLVATGRCSQVQISLDGSRPETHEAARGPGSFAPALRGLRTILRHGIRATVRVTIHRHNVDNLTDLTRLLLDDLGLPSFGTNAAGFLGSCRSNADLLILTTAERERVMATLLRLSDQYPGRIQASAGPLAEAKRWRKMEEARHRAAPPFPDGGFLTGCGCCFSRLAVRSDGTVVPCPMLSDVELGRVNRDRLADIWLNSQALNDLRDRRKITLSSFEFCAGCDYQPYCTGNCPGLAHSLTGRIDHPSPDACLRDFIRQGGRLPAETVEAA